MMVTFLFNGEGTHIANVVKGQLYLPDGAHVGSYQEEKKIFVDLSGHYLGELLYGNRLLCNQFSPYRHERYVPGDKYNELSNIGNYGDPGKESSIGTIDGYEDVVLK